MIPSFPTLRPLRHDDRQAVEALTGHLPPYSDFNFTSLWCWNVSGAVRLSQLHGSLVVRFADYITNEAFYSFCGGSADSQTAATLIDFARSEGLPAILKLLPGESVADLSTLRFDVREDPDNFDYILSIEKVGSFCGNRLRGKRNFVQRFCRQNHTTTRELDLTADAYRNQIEKLLSRWAANKELSLQDTQNEFTAIRRFFECSSFSNFVTMGVIDADRLIGFSISEVLPGGYAMLHFEKGDIDRIGIYPYIMQETARRLSALGCRYLNYQQDLGVPGLRDSKRSYSPCTLLKKFRVTNVA